MDRWSYTNLTKPNVELPPPPQETVFRAGHWEQEPALQPGTLAGDCASAKVLFNRGDYADAEKVYHWLAGRAEKEKNATVFEECLFMEAECLYAQRRFPKARDTYARLLKEFPSSRYRCEAVQRQFAIAEYWLNDTREEMKERENNNRWWSLNFTDWVHFEKEKPTFDLEGYAHQACEAIYVQDPAGPLAPHALYRCGGLSFYRERFDEADNYYSLLTEQYPRSPLAAPALELAIQAKISQVHGPAYDSRKLVEARQLVETALRSYPELADKRDDLERTLITINEQQAEKDFNIAEFYRRTGHPGAAYFYYELVRRRYAGSGWAQRATDKLKELRIKVETEAEMKIEK